MLLNLIVRKLKFLLNMKECFTRKDWGLNLSRFIVIVICLKKRRGASDRCDKNDKDWWETLECWFRAGKGQYSRGYIDQGGKVNALRRSGIVLWGGRCFCDKFELDLGSIARFVLCSRGRLRARVGAGSS